MIARRRASALVMTGPDTLTLAIDDPTQGRAGGHARERIVRLSEGAAVDEFAAEWGPGGAAERHIRGDRVIDARALVRLG